MKRKKQLKPKIQTSRRFASQVNMHFIQQIMDKYDVGKSTSQPTKLIFRQYRRMLTGENKKTDSVINTILKHYSHYLNINKSVFNLITKVIDPINTKSNKELPPVPFDILRFTPCNSHDYSALDWFSRVQKQLKDYREIGVTNKLTVVNLFKEISEKYNNTLLKKVAPDHNGLFISEKTETKWIEPKASPKDHLKNKDPELSRTITFEQKPLSNRVSNVTTNGVTNSATNKVTNKAEKGAITNKSAQILLKGNCNIDTEIQDKKKTMVLKTTSCLVEESPEKEKEVFKQSEMLLHTSVAKSVMKQGFTTNTQGFIKSALVQADGAISKILKNFSQKQNVDNLRNGFLNKNIYQRSSELIPLEVKQDRKARGIATKFVEKQEIKKQTHEDSSLTLCKPYIKGTGLETGQTPKDVLHSEKETYAKAITSSRPHKNIEVIGNDEVNLLAERILKVLEKRMVIQKDRRGLR